MRRTARRGRRKVLSTWPLVGADADVERWRGARRRPRGVVIVGEAGTGKTRLATELVAATAAEDGLHVARGDRVAGCRAGAARGVGAPAARQPGNPAPTTSRRGGCWPPASSRRGGAIHLFVDDAQWLDPVSAGLVHHLVTSGRRRR